MRRLRKLLIIASLGLVTSAAGQAQQWQTPAKWHRTFETAVPGTLVLDENGVEFRSAKLTRRWMYVDIHTFKVSLRELTLLTYENRPLRAPGERPFRITMADAMPSEVAAQFAERVGKPAENDTPLQNAGAIAEIPAHHRVWIGGSNGKLRLKDDGIDYVTEDGRDSRSWRWTDIQTLGNPNPYEFRVTAYREIVEFDLKQPMARDVFERMWDRLYATGLNLSTTPAEVHQ